MSTMSDHLKVTVAQTEKIHFGLPPPSKVSDPSGLSIVKNVTTITTVSSETTILSTDSVHADVIGTLPPKGIVSPKATTGSRVSVPLEASTESVPMNTGESTERVSQNVTSESMSVPMNETTLSESSDESTETVYLETSESIETSDPLESSDKLTENVHTEVTSELMESIPPNATILSLTDDPPELIGESNESVHVEVTSESATECGPPNTTTFSFTSVPPESIGESTESAHLEVISESTERIENATTLSLTNVSLDSINESTKSAHDQEVTSKSIKSVPLNATISSMTIVLPESICTSTEIANNLKVTSESTNCVPPNATTSSLTRVPPESICETNKSTNMEVTSESTESVKPPSQESGPSKVTSKLPSPRLTDQELTKARDDAIDLHRAFQGRSCDATTIVNILADRSAKHRSLIRQEYKKKFSEGFDDRLSRELLFKRDLKRALKLWMDDPATRVANLVKDGLSKNLNVAIEVICSRTPSEIENIKKAYRSMFGSYLLDDIESHAAYRDHKLKLLYAYAGTPRSESLEIDETMVDRDAKALFKDGEWKTGTTEYTFIRIFSERSSAHLAAVNIAYRKMYMNSLKKAVKKETSWKFKWALLTILQCAENRGKYFAKALHKSMKGIGTDDETLTRIIVSRAEVDMQQIKTEYHNKYRKPLSDVVIQILLDLTEHFFSHF